MFIAVLGRQPEISLAELRAVYGQENIQLVSPYIATINTTKVNISDLGGTIKCGEIIHKLPTTNRPDKPLFIDTSHKITQLYKEKWKNIDHKITLGISAYGFNVSPRDVQKTGLLLKSSLKKSGVSLRLIPNDNLELSTATSHNNKLGLSPNKVELIVVKLGREVIVAESRGAQNITAYAKRDRDRPKRDAFVGMLPPKLAQIMVNLAGCNVEHQILLDPFCGTGTVLQEALLKNYTVYGSDLNPKMINYSIENLNWLQKTHHTTGKVLDIRTADATDYKWNEAKQLNLIVCETYLGQPFSAPPSPKKLQEVVGNCNHIINKFLTNIRSQISSDTRLCIAVPAWRDTEGRFTHLPLTRSLNQLGYTQENTELLLYHRPDQVVGRQILILTPN